MVPALKRVEDILKWMAHPKNMNRVPVKGPNDGMKGYVCERELGKFRAVAKKMRDRGIEPAPGSPIAILNELFKGFDNKWYMQSPRVGKTYDGLTVRAMMLFNKYFDSEPSDAYSISAGPSSATNQQQQQQQQQQLDGAPGGDRCQRASSVMPMYEGRDMMVPSAPPMPMVPTGFYAPGTAVLISPPVWQPTWTLTYPPIINYPQPVPQVYPHVLPIPPIGMNAGPSNIIDHYQEYQYYGQAGDGSQWPSVSGEYGVIDRVAAPTPEVLALQASGTGLNTYGYTSHAMRTNREASSRPYGSIKTAERPRSSFAGGAADELYRSECRAGKMKKRVKRAPHTMASALDRVEGILNWIAKPENMNKIPVRGENDHSGVNVCGRELGKLRGEADEMHDSGIEPTPGSPIAILHELFKGFDNEWYKQSPRAGKEYPELTDRAVSLLSKYFHSEQRGSDSH